MKSDLFRVPKFECAGQHLNFE